MVEIAEIRDEESFEAWLKQENLPREAMVALAHRAAMRVLPVAWQRFNFANEVSQQDVSTLPLLQSALVSEVAACFGTLEVRSAAARVKDRSEAVLAGAAWTNFAGTVRVTGTFRTFAVAQIAALEAAAAPTDPDVVSSVARAAFIASDPASVTAWAALRVDCSCVSDVRALLARPLWGETTNSLAGDWRAITSRIDPQANPEWAFWLDWYQRALDGTETRWALLRDIALLDKDADGRDVWISPARVAQAIADLQARHALSDAARIHPYAWDMRVGRGAALVRVPKEVVDVSDIVSATRRALNEHKARCKVRSGQSDIGPYIDAAFSDAIRELRKKLSKYKSNPAELHRVLEETRLELIGISRQDGFENDPIANRLIGNLTVRAQDICVAAPSVLEMVEARQKVQLRLMSAEFVQVARHLCAGLGNDATGELRIAAALALSVLSNPDSSDVAKLGAFQFVQAAVPRAALAALEFEEAQDKNASGKTVAERAETWARRIKAVDQTVDIAQEAVNEAQPWIMEAIQNFGLLFGGTP